MQRKKRQPRQADHVKRIVRLFGGPTEVGKLLGIHRTSCYTWLNGIPEKHALKLFLYARRQHMGLTLKDFTPDLIIEGWEPSFNDNNDLLGKESC